MRTFTPDPIPMTEVSDIDIALPGANATVSAASDNAADCAITKYHQAVMLTVFYDSKCPLCAIEMRQLKGFDHSDVIKLVDIHQSNFIQQYPYIDPIKANRVLHARTDSGEILTGLDVTHRAWSLVGQHKWLAILRWPVVRWFADAAYYIFARYRSRISWLLTGQARCRQGTCI